MALFEQFRQRLAPRVKVQLAVFGAVALVASAVMIFGYMRLPAMFGAERYTVTVQLPRAGGLYASGNVTYRGTEIGRVTEVHLTETGVDAVLSLRSDISIPANVDASVHSVSGVGEQYVALQPRNGNGPALKNGDVIPVGRTSVPPEINSLLDAANRGLQAIPRDNLKTVVDESYAAVGGLGPELSRLVMGSTQLAIDARANLDPLLALIDRAKPVLDSQADSADAIRRWASHLADLTRQVQTNDSSAADLLENGGTAADEARQLIDRLQAPLSVLLANLVSVGQVARDYQPAIEQLLVMAPQVVADYQAMTVTNRNMKRPYAGLTAAFNLNLNLPPTCTTGFLPAQQVRPPTFVDTPDRPRGDLYCRVPQDSWLAVRGARNFPCLTQPGKRAPTAKMCESDEEYVPLNDGFSWKGDPNATLSGQGVPQQRPGSVPAQAAPQPAPAPLAAADYNPTTGEYEGSDGRVYRASDVNQTAERKTWESMLTPPAPTVPEPLPLPTAALDYDTAAGHFVGSDGRVYSPSVLARTQGRKPWQSMLTPLAGE